SLAVMNGMPLMVVAKNLGHVDTKMVEHTYGHLSNTYITESIRANAPRFGAAADGRVSPLRHRRGRLKNEAKQSFANLKLWGKTSPDRRMRGIRPRNREAPGSRKRERPAGLFR